jgi:hypothetical protein
VVELGVLRRLDPRVAWADEARHFTPWLRENPALLAEALGIDVELRETEHPVGGFSCDLVGRDLTNDAMLIVENQLEQTDHSHLGQLLTYAAGTDAATIVWIARGFRDEHRQAIDWLNERTAENTHFFGLEIELVQIEGQERAAPLFKVVAEPNDWQKQVRAATSTGTSGKSVLYADFWAKFLEAVRAKHPDWTRARKPTAANWFEMPSPVRGATISAAFAMSHRMKSELYIDTGDGDQNLGVFNALLAQREALESAYGRTLEFEELPGRRACRIAEYADGDVSETEQHQQYIGWMIDAGERLRRALGAVTLRLPTE